MPKKPQQGHIKVPAPYIADGVFSEDYAEKLTLGEQRLHARALYFKARAEQKSRVNGVRKKKVSQLQPITPEHMYFGWRVAQFRELRGLTKSAAATRGGFRIFRWREIEAGSIEVSFSDIVRIAQVLHTHPWALMVGLDEMDLMRPSYPVQRAVSPKRDLPRLVRDDYDDIGEHGTRPMKLPLKEPDPEKVFKYSEQDLEDREQLPLEAFFSETEYAEIEAGFLPNAEEQFDSMERTQEFETRMRPSKRKRQQLQRKMAQASQFPDVNARVEYMAKLAAEAEDAQEKRRQMLRAEEE